MKSYLFALDGINKEIWSSGNSEKEAKNKMWIELSDEDKNNTASIECIDEK